MAALADTVVPRGPYWLELSVARAGDSTRRVRGGRVEAAFGVDGRVDVATAWQRADGRVEIRAPSENALAQMRFVLALDADHSPFLRRFARDPVLGPTIRLLPGMRQVRLSTVTQAVLRALCGQLIDSRRARAIERRVIRAATPRDEASGLHAPPTPAALARFSPAELCRYDLTARKASAAVRMSRTLDLERLRTLPPDAVAARLERERGFGPWSVGTVFLEGLGRCDRGLVGDLSLVKLYAALHGRWVEPAETAELLEPYGEWAGLASVYLLAGAARGLVPGANFDRARAVRVVARRVRSGVPA